MATRPEMNLRLLSVLLFFVLGVAQAAGRDAPAKDCLGAPLPASLVNFLAQNGYGKAGHYVVDWYNLKGDDSREAIVHLDQPSSWCGSGGCFMLVLHQRASHWVVVGRTSTVKLPIRVLLHRSHGWHSLGVFVQGGGIIKGYEAVLDFNGTHYPSNTSMSPARPLRGRTLGKVLMEYSAPGKIICHAY